MPFLKKDDNKIALAMEAMAQLLEMQSTQKSWQLSAAMQELPRLDLTASCGEHDDCADHLHSIWEAVAVRFPGCRSRRYVDGMGEVYFVVLSDFSELSPKLGVAHSECRAWEMALDAQHSLAGG
ncbi:hypothetical protein [Pseudoduganella lutea]|uniref:Uncharacterized protein n=1 Tax=Pseudoduganella lutea TaxID=321985 RepID=A0A4V0Z4B4_9BURK|nr:hypothetical protein [Pseudoduganella lutea]QBE66353.1 hypothetical protein EWM63_28055 [Pseudoduganella lutea]